MATGRAQGRLFAFFAKGGRRGCWRKFVDHATVYHKSSSTGSIASPPAKYVTTEQSKQGWGSHSVGDGRKTRKPRPLFGSRGCSTCRCLYQFPNNLRSLSRERRPRMAAPRFPTVCVHNSGVIVTLNPVESKSLLPPGPGPAAKSSVSPGATSIASENGATCDPFTGLSKSDVPLRST
jgi:hypothetical protein